MKQSRLESMLEITANYTSGFVIAWATYAYIVLPIPWLMRSPFWVTVLFTVISIARSYYWRRFFEAGFHKIAHRIAKDLLTTTEHAGPK